MTEKITALLSILPQEYDAVLITSALNRRYYTGLRSSAGTLLITREKAYFIIDFRYIELAKRHIKGCEVILQSRLGEQLDEIAKRHGLKTIGIESSYFTVGAYLDYSKMFTEAKLLLDSRVDELIMGQRRYKSRQELLIMQQAQDLADRCFTHILDFIKAGKTELEVAMELHHFSRLAGSEGDAFDIIAVSGINSSLPHGVPTNKKLEIGDLFTMDFGVKIDGYVSDMTRTVAIGQIGEEQKRMYDTVLKAQHAALAVIKPGIPCVEVDKAARDVIYQAGYEGCFGHGLGHSLGLQVHEDPRFSIGSTAITEPGLVMSVEPGIYLEGRFGCRIEDVVYITEDGFINLTHSPKELIIIK